MWNKKFYEGNIFYFIFSQNKNLAPVFFLNYSLLIFFKKFLCLFSLCFSNTNHFSNFSIENVPKWAYISYIWKLILSIHTKIKCRFFVIESVKNSWNYFYSLQIFVIPWLRFLWEEKMPTPTFTNTTKVRKIYSFWY